MSNQAGLSKPWVLNDDSIGDAALLFKHCGRIPYAQVILHILADHPDQIYSLPQLAREAETDTYGISEAIRLVDRAIDAYGRAPLIQKVNDGYRVAEGAANVLKAAWESWSS
ncbi:hypothetical protein ACFQ08_04025 [Streptosporangium algeriense]|uniref:Uncharacterized protein n=1 Tax=Streptosporangium algeriense TaxID=1682748 RepID=A0ABW3DJ06_9ACTN